MKWRMHFRGWNSCFFHLRITMPGLASAVKLAFWNASLGCIECPQLCFVRLKAGSTFDCWSPEMHALSTRDVIVDEAMGEMLECSPGLLLSEATFVRKTPGAELPMSHLKIYVPARYAAAQDRPTISNTPVYQTIEKLFNVRVCEIRQNVTGTLLDVELAEILNAPVGEPALQMTRFYYDANQSLVQVTVSYYPRSRYTQSARFRISEDRVLATPSAGRAAEAYDSAAFCGARITIQKAAIRRSCSQPGADRIEGSALFGEWEVYKNTGPQPTDARVNKV